MTDDREHWKRILRMFVKSFTNVTNRLQETVFKYTIVKRKKLYNKIYNKRRMRMRKKDVLRKVSAYAITALIATTSVAPAYAADFTGKNVVVAGKVSVTSVSDMTFGSNAIALKAGNYTIPVGMKKASDITQNSMAAKCIKDARLLVANDGTAKLVVNLQAISVMNVSAWAKNWKVYKSAQASGETVDAQITHEKDGNADQITFTIPDITEDGIYLNMYIDAMGMAQDVYMTVDYANAKVQTEEKPGTDNTSKPNTKTESKPATNPASKKQMPSIKVKVTSKILKVKTLKKKAQTINIKSSVNSKSKLSFKKISGSGKIKINKTNGNLTVKKGTKKGTYKIKIQVTAAAKGNYTAGRKTVNIKIRVK